MRLRVEQPGMAVSHKYKVQGCKLSPITEACADLAKAARRNAMSLKQLQSRLRTGHKIQEKNRSWLLGRTPDFDHKAVSMFYCASGYLPSHEPRRSWLCFDHRCSED